MPRVVSNTTPLQYLHRIGKLELLRELFGTVIVPASVATEIKRGRELGHDLPDVPTIPYLLIQQAPQTELAAGLSDLGAGEVSGSSSWESRKQGLWSCWTTRTEGAVLA